MSCDTGLWLGLAGLQQGDRRSRDCDHCQPRPTQHHGENGLAARTTRAIAETQHVRACVDTLCSVTTPCPLFACRVLCLYWVWTSGSTHVSESLDTYIQFVAHLLRRPLVALHALVYKSVCVHDACVHDACVHAAYCRLLRVQPTVHVSMYLQTTWTTRTCAQTISR